MQYIHSKRQVTLYLKVKPSSKVEKIGSSSLINEKEYLEVFVNAKAKSGAANSAVIKLLSKYFSVTQNQISIALGNNSKYKTLVISGVEENKFDLIKSYVHFKL